MPFPSLFRPLLWTEVEWLLEDKGTSFGQQLFEIGHVTLVCFKHRNFQRNSTLSDVFNFLNHSKKSITVISHRKHLTSSFCLLEYFVFRHICADPIPMEKPWLTLTQGWSPWRWTFGQAWSYSDTAYIVRITTFPFEDHALEGSFTSVITFDDMARMRGGVVQSKISTLNTSTNMHTQQSWKSMMNQMMIILVSQYNS